jgi:asparagine synthetase B (glutamine-hydrolysing)
MCGIYGYFGEPKDKNRMPKIVECLAIESQIRGTDSTGYLAVSEDEYKTSKWAVSAKEFYSGKNGKSAHADIREAQILVGHNRASSIGKINNTNAHPFIGDRYILVHNGTCTKAVKDFKAKRLEREGTTDSEAILANMENDGIRYIKNCSGYAIVLYDLVKDTLYFTRDNSRPMWIFNTEDDLGVTIFCSTKKIGLASLCKAGVKVKSFRRLIANRLYKLTKKGKLKAIDKWDPAPPDAPLIRRRISRKASEAVSRYYRDPGWRNTRVSSSDWENALVVHGD